MIREDVVENIVMVANNTGAIYEKWTLPAWHSTVEKLRMLNEGKTKLATVVAESCQSDFWYAAADAAVDAYNAQKQYWGAENVKSIEEEYTKEEINQAAWFLLSECLDHLELHGTDVSKVKCLIREKAGR